MPDEKSVLDEVRYLLSFLPSNNLEEPPRIMTGDDPDRLCENLRDLLPLSPSQPYDMKKVITSVVDGGDYMEVHATYAQQVTCGFARIDGHTVGIVANQPQILAGVLDIDSAEKAARFVRTCDAFNVPIVTFVDVPGFMPGVDQEYGGIIRHGAKLLYAFCEATVPRISIITRKAYGGAYVVMNSKSIGADLAYAWPTAELAVMGSSGAVEHRPPPRPGGRRRPRRAAHGAHRGLRGALRDALHRGRARLRRRRDRPGRHAADPQPVASTCCAASARTCPSASTGTSRCEPRAARRGRPCPTRRWPPLIAAAEQVAASLGARPAPDEVPAWRFSGRWFNRGPLADRRPRRG